MTDDPANADASALIERYVAAAVNHGQASQEGRHEQANEAYDIIAASYRELRRRGLAAQRQLLSLLVHPEAFVRVWAGAHALEFAPDEGEATLLRLTTEDRGLAGLSAKTTLDEWKAGHLKFD